MITPPPYQNIDRPLFPMLVVPNISGLHFLLLEMIKVFRMCVPFFVLIFFRSEAGMNVENLLFTFA